MALFSSSTKVKKAGGAKPDALEESVAQVRFLLLKILLSWVQFDRGGC